MVDDMHLVQNIIGKSGTLARTRVSLAFRAHTKVTGGAGRARLRLRRLLRRALTRPECVRRAGRFLFATATLAVVGVA